MPISFLPKKQIIGHKKSQSRPLKGGISHLKTAIRNKTIFARHLKKVTLKSPSDQPKKKSYQRKKIAEISINRFFTEGLANTKSTQTHTKRTNIN